ncbi:MAG: hypothetical protein HUU19_13565 [Phycisphaerales bacterium]|nr:hypothetical protein [Phycisphaerales bacterium]
MRLTALGSLIAILILALVVWRIARQELGEAVSKLDGTFTAVDAMVAIAVLMIALLALCGGREEGAARQDLPPSRPPDETRTWW